MKTGLAGNPRSTISIRNPRRDGARLIEERIECVKNRTKPTPSGVICIGSYLNCLFNDVSRFSGSNFVYQDLPDFRNMKYTTTARIITTATTPIMVKTREPDVRG